MVKPKLNRLLSIKYIEKVFLAPIIRCFLMIGLFLLAGNVTCQVVTGKKLLLEADSLKNAELFKPAQVAYLAAQELFKSNNDWENWYKCFKNVCRINIKTKNVGFLIDSVQVFIEVIPSDQTIVKGKAYSYLAYAQKSLGRNRIASQNLESAIFQKLLTLDTTNQKSVASLMGSYFDISSSYSNLGDQQSAIDYIKEAIRYAEMIGHKNLCKYYSVIGKYYFHNNQNDLALLSHKNTIDKCGESAVVYQYLAEVNFAMDSLEKVNYFLKLSDSQLIIFNEDCNYLQEVLEARYFEKIGEHEKSISILRELFEKENCFPSERTRTKELVNYAQTLYRNNYKEESIHFSDETLNSFFSQVDSSGTFVRPKLNDGLPDVWIIEAMLLKAKYYIEQYNLTKENKFLNEAEFYYDALFYYFDNLKLAFTSIKAQYRIGGYTQAIYSDVISYYINLFVEYNDVSHFDKAYTLAQKNNAFVLRNSINDRMAFEIYKVPKEKIDIYFYLQSRANENDNLNSVKAKLDFKIFENEIFLSYPALKKYYNDQIATLTETQNKLNEGELFLKYYFDNDKLFSFVISKTKCKIFEHELPQNFDLNFDRLYTISSDPEKWNESDFKVLSSQTYNFLLKEVLSDNDFKSQSSLIVVPDGPLKKLSFSSLIINDVNNFILPSNYLISTHDISYLFYAGQIANTENKKSSDGKFIGFGIEYTDEFLKEIINDYKSYSKSKNETRSFSLANLPFADDEVMRTAKLLGGKSFINNKVTPSSVIDNLKNYSIVHFSAHALNNNSDYLNSFLVLNKNENQEFKFKFKDIINLNLENELVVLSACQTGVGENIESEGTMSLSRAFLQSGADASLGSYWNAHDKSTMEFMTLFYKFLDNGLTKPKALQQAQLEYLTNDNISSPLVRSPFYWSGWAMYGNGKSLAEEATLLRNTLIVCGLGLCFTLFLIYNSRSNK